MSHVFVCCRFGSELMNVGGKACVSCICVLQVWF